MNVSTTADTPIFNAIVDLIDVFGAASLLDISAATGLTPDIILKTLKKNQSVIKKSNGKIIGLRPPEDISLYHPQNDGSVMLVFVNDPDLMRFISYSVGGSYEKVRGGMRLYDLTEDSYVALRKLKFYPDHNTAIQDIWEERMS